MPKKGYKQTKEHKDKLRNKILGIKRSKETKEKQRLNQLGKTNSFFGKYHLKETKRKQSLAQLGKIVSKETRKRLSITTTKVHIERRKKGITYFTKDSKKKMSLSHGGTGIPYELTEYGPEFDSALKEQVRFREGYKCKICSCSQIENSRQLDVHHIDYDKKNNDIWNLISLCRSCHVKTNYNREYWKKYLKNIIASVKL